MWKFIVLRNKRGVTLLALVITIIVLLILAGITISAITEENGIIRNAGQAKEETEVANEKEVIEKAVVQAMGNNKYGILEESELQNELDKETGEGKTDATDIGEEFEVIFVDSNRYYTVDKDGNVGEAQDIIKDKNPGDITVGKDGETLNGSEENPYQIWCIEDLVEWSQNYGKYTNSCIKLCTTLNLKSKLSYADSERIDYGNLNGNENDGNTLMNEMITGTGFKPIQYFYGTLDGNFNHQYHEIKNIYINQEKDAGFIIAGNNSTVIKNLSISGEISSTEHAAGIICGNHVGHGMTIINCKNYATVTGNIMVGGICAWARNISVQNCENYGKIYIESVNYPYGGAGGIIAYGNGTIQDCCNQGEVYGNYRCGGIVGYASNNNMEIKNCFNIGEIHSIGNYACGGILGKSASGTINIMNCMNTATIGEESTGDAGGIVGEYEGVDYTTDRTLNIYNSYNIGNVVSQNYCGGILGRQGLVSLSIQLNIENCYSAGEIGGKYAGGIVGNLTDSTSRTTVTSSIKNTYYLNTSANKTIYEGTCTEKEQIESYDVSYMKSEKFCNILNNHIRENEGWKKWIFKDNTYPSFA